MIISVCWVLFLLLDADECTNGNNECAVGRSVCMDNEGSYTCTCKSGYVSAEGVIMGRQCDGKNFNFNIVPLKRLHVEWNISTNGAW